jgi:PAS domain S-box-containing protein
MARWASRIIPAALAIIFIFSAISACINTAAYPEKSNNTEYPFTSFLDIPDITKEEIESIAALQRQTDVLIYGTTPNTESFINNDGEISGFTAMLCDWMTDMFDIKIKPRMYSWGGLLEGLETGEVDFTGELTSTEERRKIYFMTSAISERVIKYFRLENRLSFAEIAQSRPLRYAFFTGTTTWLAVTESFSDLDFETVFVDDSSLVHDMLKNGEIDAFFNEGPGEYAFDVYGDVNAYSFVPLIYEPVSLAARKDILSPIISVMQKAMLNGGRHYLSQIYNKSYNDYLKRKMYMRLTEDEHAYIQNNPVIRFVAEYDNYPISFYNTHEKEWQGIALDVIQEIERLTGLKFERINDHNADWPELLEMLERREAMMITELLRTSERERQFIWPKNFVLSENFVLISKLEYPHLNLNEILNARVALRKETAYMELFNRWFPDHTHTFEYENSASAFNALKNGEVDIVMSSRKELLAITNYDELPGYKANFVFDRTAESTFGFRADEGVLAGIVDKALGLIDVSTISNNWMTKTYDYRIKVAQAQRPFLIGATALSLVVLVLIMILFFRSRSERRHLAKLVAEKTSTLMAIFDATPDLIFCKDSDLRHTECNKALENHLNIRKSDIIGKNDAQAFNFPHDLNEHYAAKDKKVIAEKQISIVEETIPGADGKVRLFETIKSPIIDDGKAIGLVGISRDITQRKAAEEEAKRATDEAKAASEAKSHFIANMSHEMRTPMNVIVGLTDLMLEESSIPGSIKDTMKKINTAGNTLMGLINDVLDISKIEAGKLELIPVQYSTASMLNDIITLNAIRIREKPVTFKLDIDEELPSTLFGDDLRVKQILNNFLSNAFKYTKEGTVTLAVSHRRENNDIWLAFSVSDTGIGIRKEDMEKLFSDYNQVDTKANRTIEGTGLGLSITKKFVELMRGEISVESEYGKGTVFRTSICQGFVTEDKIGKETAENLRGFRYSDTKRQASEKLVRSDLSYVRVLVVDDFSTNLDVAAGMLGKYKMKVDCVLSGQEAIDRITAGDPLYDAIFMDHMMPGMDGMEATKAIRALGTGYAQGIPVIALTANVVAGNEQIFIENGFNAFLPKPFNAVNLDKIVQRWVRDKSRE